MIAGSHDRSGNPVQSERNVAMLCRIGHAPLTTAMRNGVHTCTALKAESTPRTLKAYTKAELQKKKKMISGGCPHEYETERGPQKVDAAVDAFL